MVSNEPSVVAALAKAGAMLDARDEKGRTPLHLAAGLATTPATVNALVSAGATLDARDDRDRTPLEIAEAFSEALAVLNALRAATQTAGRVEAPRRQVLPARTGTPVRSSRAPTVQPSPGASTTA